MASLITTMKNLIKRILYTAQVTLIFVTSNANSKPVIPSKNPTFDGLYAGVNLGFFSPSNRNLNTTANNLQYCTTAQGCTGGFIYSQASASGATQSTSINKNSFIGGGQLGYNFMLHNHYLIGIETDIQGLSSGNQKASSSNTSNFFAPASGLPQSIVTNINISREVSYIGTVRARLGYAFGQKLLLSGTGGLAYGSVNSSTQLYQNYAIPGSTITGLGANWTSTGNYSKTHAGWVVGALCEYLLNTNWSVKFEYLHYSLGSIKYSNTNLVDPITVPYTPQDFFTNTMNTTTNFNGSILRFGINYHFA